jgi:asparagine synthase (glutamine-hydrolysing)
MCGIFLILSKQKYFTHTKYKQIIQSFNKIKHRGPDDTSITIFNNCIIGFHRLAINDLSENGMQPFITKNINQETQFTMCNGEIYNYDKLLEDNQEINQQLKSTSDCEILPHLFNKYGFKETIEMLDSVFATCHITNDYVHVASDKIGVKPIFYADNDNFFAICSEAKGLDDLFNKDEIQRLTPGSIFRYNINENYKTFYKYWSIYDNQNITNNDDFNVAIQKVENLLTEAVKKRMTSDREIGCLLSGGLDSSIVASILAREMKKQGKKLATFSVGFPGSTDLHYAKIVAQHIDSEHNELILDYNQTLQKIPEIIQQIETTDTTTIRASTPMYILCEWINKNFPHKVIFSGEGSDEICASYLYFHNTPSLEAGHMESLRLVNQLYLYDVLRADRSTSSHGLEFREPFLDINLITYIQELNPSFIIPTQNEIEKKLLRLAFKNYLPEIIVWRQKEAFSDGVTNSNIKPWFKYIQEYAEMQEKNKYGGTDENNWYKTIFYNYFKNYRPNIPLWLPKWVDVGQEPSATVLNVYKSN